MHSKREFNYIKLGFFENRELAQQCKEIMQKHGRNATLALIVTSEHFSAVTRDILNFMPNLEELYLIGMDGCYENHGVKAENLKKLKIIRLYGSKYPNFIPDNVLHHLDIRSQSQIELKEFLMTQSNIKVLESSEVIQTSIEHLQLQEFILQTYVAPDLQQLAKTQPQLLRLKIHADIPFSSIGKIVESFKELQKLDISLENATGEVVSHLSQLSRLHHLKELSLCIQGNSYGNHPEPFSLNALIFKRMPSLTQLKIRSYGSIAVPSRFWARLSQTFPNVKILELKFFHFGIINEIFDNFDCLETGSFSAIRSSDVQWENNLTKTYKNLKHLDLWEFSNEILLKIVISSPNLLSMKLIKSKLLMDPTMFAILDNLSSVRKLDLSKFYMSEDFQIPKQFIENLKKFKTLVKFSATFSFERDFHLKTPNVVKSVVRRFKETFMEVEDFKVWESDDTIYLNKRQNYVYSNKLKGNRFQ